MRDVKMKELKMVEKKVASSLIKQIRLGHCSARFVLPLGCAVPPQVMRLALHPASGYAQRSRPPRCKCSLVNYS